MTRITTRNPRRRQSRRGFTLTEVLLVLAILGVIAAMVVPNLIGQQKAAMIKAARMSIKSVEDAATQYAIAHDGEYPTDMSVLMNPGADSTGRPISPYLKDIPKDPWGQTLNYKWDNSGSSLVPNIWSSGPDKINAEGSGDDISNWADKAAKT